MDDDDHRVRHLAMLSQYTVFKDIIPSYRIRMPTATEMATKVSKDVQRVRSQEAALLKAYQVHKTRKSALECSHWRVLSSHIFVFHGALEVYLTRRNKLNCFYRPQYCEFFPF